MCAAPRWTRGGNGYSPRRKVKNSRSADFGNPKPAGRRGGGRDVVSQKNGHGAVVRVILWLTCKRLHLILASAYIASARIRFFEIRVSRKRDMRMAIA